jgi:uncharacterized RDD family membrane protein YckC
MTSAISDQQPLGSSGSPLVYAGFWIRFFAYLLDVIILYVILLVIMVVVALAMGLAFHGSASGIEAQRTAAGVISVVTMILGTTISIAYFVLFLSGKWQATPGKRLLGIHVIAVNGEKIGGWLAFRRWLTYIVSALPLYVGFMVIGWNAQKKAFHDSICETRVVYGRL